MDDSLEEAIEASRGVVERHSSPEKPAAGNSLKELVFDPMIGCYYDPKTNEYYSLGQNAHIS